MLWTFIGETVCQDLKVLVAQSCLTPCDLIDCSPSGSSVRGISQARILEWIVIPFFRGIFLTQGLNLDLPHCRQILYRWSHQGNPGKTWGDIWEGQRSLTNRQQEAGDFTPTSPRVLILPTTSETGRGTKASMGLSPADTLMTDETLSRTPNESTPRFLFFSHTQTCNPWEGWDNEYII